MGGPSGTPYKMASESPEFVNELQHGHLFLGMQDDITDSCSKGAPQPNSDLTTSSSSWFLAKSVPSKTTRIQSLTPDFVGSLLLGIEGSAPLKTNLFGQTHGPTGKSNALSAFGKQKW